MSMIWATRGKRWGFRFLRDGGYTNVLEEYERAFRAIGTSMTEFHKDERSIAIRMPDPAGRTDRAGRVIPHEFVLTDEDAIEVNKVEDVLEKIWPTVAEEYDEIWDR